MGNSAISSFLVISSIVSFSQSVSAYNSEEPSNPNEIVEPLELVRIHGKNAEKLSNIQREDIEAYQPQDLSDLLKNVPSINVGGSTTNNQRLYLRGVESTNLNVTIDGAKQGQNLFQHRGGLSRIDPLLLKRVDIDAGTAAADQGPGALAGSVQLTTIDAQDILEGRQSSGASLRGAYGSADDYVQGSAAVYGMLDQYTGVLFYHSDAKNEELRTGGGGEVPNSSGEDDAYILKLSMLNRGAHSLRLIADRYDNEGTYAWKAGDLPAAFYQGKKNFDPERQALERETLSANYQWQPDNPLVDLAFNIYRNSSDLENFDRGLLYSSETIGSDLRNTLRVSTGVVKHEVTVGADYFRDQGRSQAKDGQGDDTKRNTGLFLQDRMSIGNWKISTGLRYDDYKTEYRHLTTSGDELSVNLSAEYNFTEQLSVFGGYGEATRGYGTMPVGWAGRITEDAIFRDGDLNPERSELHEIGLRYWGENTFLDEDNLEFSVKAFKTRIKDLIDFDGGPGGAPVTAFYNSGEFESRGIEFGLGWLFGSYETHLGFTHTDLRDEDDDILESAALRRLGAPTGNKWTWSHKYTFTNDVKAGYDIIAVQRLKDVPKGEHEKAGYAVHSINLQWTPKKIENLQLNFSINNLFDKRYINHTTISKGDYLGTEEAGRDVRFVANYKF